MRPGEVLQKIAAPAFAVTLGLGVTACGGGGDSEELRANGRKDANTTTTTVASDGCENPAMSPAAQKRAGNELNGIYQHFEAGELSIGCDDVDFASNPREASATASFTQEELGVLDTQEEIAAFFASGDERAVKARARVIASMKYEKLPQAEIDRAMNGECFIPVQAEVPTVIEGTTYFVDGEILEAAGRATGANDIYWFCFTKAGHLVKGASLRADCTNPDVDVIRPRRPGEDVPPVEVIPYKVPEPVIHQSVPNAPLSGGSREVDGTPDDSNHDGYDVDRNDADGGPKDADKDGFADPVDACVNSPETWNGYKDGDGCPDALPKAPNDVTPSTGVPGTGPPVTLDPGGGNPDRDDVPAEPVD